jgi:CubicO group peptidase (beta-lactamase class C family)
MDVSDLMKGFPPTPGGQVTLANWRGAPFNKWSFRHVREIVPTADIPIDRNDLWDLPSALVALQDIRVPTADRSLPLSDVIEMTDTDAMVVLHRGRIVYDHYAPGMDRDTPHIIMSVSKSILGLLAGILAERGELKVDEPVTAILPEMSGTAYEGANLRDLLDMRAGILFEENYLAPSVHYIAYRKSFGWEPYGPGETPSDLRSFLTTLTRRDGTHNGVLHYISTNTDLLGWIFERRTGRRYADLLSDLLWKPLGARTNAYITVDRRGAPRSAAGICATAEDLARVGQLVAQQGRRGSRQIVPQMWLEDIVGTGSRDAWDAGDMMQYFPGLPMHYRGKWYTWHGAARVMFGFGFAGQFLLVDPANEIVIAKLSSQALPLDKDRNLLTMAMVDAIRNCLTR